MPLQPHQWTDFLSCGICNKEFNHALRRPYSLLCGHTICKSCFQKFKHQSCPHDQIQIPTNPLPVNQSILQLLENVENDQKAKNYVQYNEPSMNKQYKIAEQYIKHLALYLKSIKKGVIAHESVLSRPMQRKIVNLIHCQISLPQGRLRCLRAIRAMGERCATELLLLHQNPSTLSASLWAAVRARGCQFLGPAMQEEALNLILLALEDGSELSRKVLVLLVVQQLRSQFPQASKTSLGHVVQLLYRASCFHVTKRDGESSLMKLKNEFRIYEALRREHDSQIVQIAREAGLRIAADQWSALLYGDQDHKPYMQSIIDKLQNGVSFEQSVQDLTMALQRSNDPGNLQRLKHDFDRLSNLSVESRQDVDLEVIISALDSVNKVTESLFDFSKNHSQQLWQDQESVLQTAKFKTSFCRDVKNKGRCPRGSSCCFAHSHEELQHHRSKHKKSGGLNSLNMQEKNTTNIDEESPKPAKTEETVQPMARQDEGISPHFHYQGYPTSKSYPTQYTQDTPHYQSPPSYMHLDPNKVPQYPPHEQQYSFPLQQRHQQQQRMPNPQMHAPSPSAGRFPYLQPQTVGRGPQFTVHVSIDANPEAHYPPRGPQGMSQMYFTGGHQPPLYNDEIRRENTMNQQQSKPSHHQFGGMNKPPSMERNLPPMVAVVRPQQETSWDTQVRSSGSTAPRISHEEQSINRMRQLENNATIKYLQSVDRSALPEPAVLSCIEEATVQQLRRRKDQILSKLIQKQTLDGNYRPTTDGNSAHEKASRFYSFWENITNVNVVDNIVLMDNEDVTDALVDVTSEMDTTTNPIMMRNKEECGLNLHNAKPYQTTKDTATKFDVKNEPAPLSALIFYSAVDEARKKLQEDFAPYINPAEDDIIPFTDKPIYSKYGPIARRVATRTVNTDLTQVNAQIEREPRPVTAETANENRQFYNIAKNNIALNLSNKDMNSYLENEFAMSQLHASIVQTQLTDIPTSAHKQKRVHPPIPQATGSMTNSNTSPTQAASTIQLLQREENAMQMHYKNYEVPEDLQLAVELQSIELTIHKKIQQHKSRDNTPEE